jgi:hypothetical protein
MTQIVTGPDGIDHEFPDETSDDVIKKVMSQNYPTSGSGIPSVPGSGQPAPTVPAQAAPPQSPPDPSHFTAMGSIGDTLRSLNQGATGGLWNPLVAGTKSLATGTPYKEMLAAENQKSADAAEVSPVSNTAVSGLGAVVGPGKLSTVEDAARLAPSFTSKLLARLGVGSAEGAAYSEANAAANQQPVVPAIEKGAAIGGPFAVAAPVITSTVGKVGNALPESVGGKAPVPTAADLRAGPGFKPQSVYDAADKLDVLANMQANLKNSGDQLDTQAAGLLRKDVTTGTSKADNLGFTGPEQDALAKVGTTTPVSSFIQQHPFRAEGMMAPLFEAPMVAFGVHGEPGMATVSGLGGAGLHLGAYFGSKALEQAGARATLGDAARIIGGVPTTGATKQAMANPDWQKAMQSLVYNSYLRQ